MSLTFLDLRNRTDTYLIEVQMDIDGYVKHMKTNLELLGLNNLIQNVYRVFKGKISKENHKFEKKFLRNE